MKLYNFLFSDGVCLKCSLAFANMREDILGTSYLLLM